MKDFVGLMNGVALTNSCGSFEMVASKPFILKLHLSLMRSAFIRSAHERTRNGRGLCPCSARAVRVANVAELREGREQCSRDRLPKVEHSVSLALRPSRAHYRNIARRNRK